MSNNPVDAGENYENKTIRQQAKEEKVDNQSATRVSFRIPVDAIMFYKRMAQHMFEGGIIKEPKFSLLAKASLNLLARRYAAYEEIALANYVQKNLAAARGPGMVTVPHMQREQATQDRQVKKTVTDFIPAKLRRPPPVDMYMPEPEWMQGW